MRMQKLIKFNRRLCNTKESMEVLNEWGFQLNPKLVEIDGRQLDQEYIILGNGHR